MYKETNKPNSRGDQNMLRTVGWKKKQKPLIILPQPL